MVQIEDSNSNKATLLGATMVLLASQNRVLLECRTVCMTMSGLSPCICAAVYSMRECPWLTSRRIQYPSWPSLACCMCGQVTVCWSHQGVTCSYGQHPLITSSALQVPSSVHLTSGVPCFTSTLGRWCNQCPYHLQLQSLTALPNRLHYLPCRSKIEQAPADSIQGLVG